MNAGAVLTHDFLLKISQMMQEEEIDVYTLSLYCMNSADLEYFNEADRARVAAIFKILSEDTKRHAELLKLITEMGGR